MIFAATERGGLTMAEYVEREALLAHIKDLPTWWADAGGYYSGAQKLPDGLFEPEDIIASIENAPAADVAPVVRCRECKYYDPEDWVVSPARPMAG